MGRPILAAAAFQVRAVRGFQPSTDKSPMRTQTPARIHAGKPNLPRPKIPTLPIRLISNVAPSELLRLYPPHSAGLRVRTATPARKETPQGVAATSPFMPNPAAWLINSRNPPFGGWRFVTPRPSGVCGAGRFGNLRGGKLLLTTTI